MENVGIFCREAMANVSRKIEGAHHEAEHEIENWLECHCIISAEGFDKHKSHLKDVFDDLNVFLAAVSSFGEVDVLLNFYESSLSIFLLLFKFES